MLCLTCRRVRPAQTRADYTAERARLIVQNGLCSCAHPRAPRAHRVARDALVHPKDTR